MKENGKELEYKKKYFWLLADIENIKARYMKEINKTKKIACEKAFKDFLPVIDSLELSYKNSKEEETKSSLRITLKIISNMLKNNNIKVINPSKFEKFNPTFHQAIISIKTPEKENLIFSVLQKGYLINKKLLRPALVGVTCK
ncbi:nucleotide exchange factor GrpE [Candidatus Vidania fulgoroideorum]